MPDRYDELDGVEENQYVSNVRKPAPSIWFVALLLVGLIGASLWFWYKAETHVEGQPLVLGDQGPKIVTETKQEGRYILVREGDRSMVVGGSAIVARRAGADEAARAEAIDSHTTSDVDEFTGSNPDTEFVGQNVTILNAYVTETNGDKVFQIASNGDEAEEMLPVYFPVPENNKGNYSVRVVTGDRVTVTGVLKEMPDASNAAKTFGLGSGEAAKVTRNALFMDAYRLVIH